MSVVITGVEPHSPARRHGIRAGMVLESINGHPIADVLDYWFYLMEKTVELSLTDGGRLRTVRLHKAEYDDIGLQFETYLMDKQRRCANNCIFCFVDQMPKGLRESLYFKDDDARLSFLFGNYVTLTNLRQQDIDRIIAMHISPINVSVHTTDPALRCEMMGNRFAGEKLAYLRQLAEGGVRLNTQLVLCPGINDGEQLDRSLRDLGALGPAVQSIALVPVGLTRYREGLYPLRPYTAAEAAAVIDQCDAFALRREQADGERIAWPADEFYLRAGRPVPEADFYGDFSQLENGVGLMALLRREFIEAVEASEPCALRRRVTLATGVDAKEFLENLVAFLQQRWHNVECEVVAIRNDFFGPTITVAGLVTGGDLIAQLRGRQLGEELLIPSVMLRHEQDRFLDDVTVEEAERALGVPLKPVRNDGYALVEAILGAPSVEL